MASMVSSFPLKELHGRKATSPLAKPEQYYATSPQAALPRSGFVLWSTAACRADQQDLGQSGRCRGNPKASAFRGTCHSRDWMNERSRDYYLGLRTIDETPLAEIAEKHLFVGHKRVKVAFSIGAPNGTHDRLSPKRFSSVPNCYLPPSAQNRTPSDILHTRQRTMRRMDSHYRNGTVLRAKYCVPQSGSHQADRTSEFCRALRSKPPR